MVVMPVTTLQCCCECDRDIQTLLSSATVAAVPHLPLPLLPLLLPSPPPAARRNAADQQAVSLTELLRSVKAELLLKDATIKSLSRDNAQRLERLRGLQAQVESLSLQVHAGGCGSQATPGRMAGGYGDTPAGSLPYGSSTLHLHGSTAAGASGGRGGCRGSSATPSSGMACGHHQPRSVAQQFTFASPAASSPAPSYIPLSAQQHHSHHQQQQQQQQQGWRHLAATALLPTMVGSSGGGRGVLAPGSPASASSASGGGASGSMHSLGAAGGAAAVAAAEPPLPSPLAAELSGPHLSFLLELVVERRVSAAQAQQVRPVCLCVLALPLQWASPPP